MKFVVFPLVILIGVAALSMMGVGTQSDAKAIHLFGGDASQGYYDSTDHLVAYPNGTAYDDAGTLTIFTDPNAGAGPWNNVIIWDNGTEYNVYDFTGQRMTGEIGVAGTIDLYDSLGLIGVVSLILIGGSIIGLKVIGIGLADASVKFAILGTILITLWGVFSVLSISAITSVPLFGPLLYFFLTAIYTFGIVQMVSGGGD